MILVSTYTVLCRSQRPPAGPRRRVRGVGQSGAGLLFIFTFVYFCCCEKMPFDDINAPICGPVVKRRSSYELCYAINDCWCLSRNWIHNSASLSGEKPYGLLSSNAPWFMCLFRHHTNCLFVCLLNFLTLFLPYFFALLCILSYLFTSFLPE